MNCCGHCQAAERHFGPTMARRDMARYHRKGPDATTRHLLGLICELDLHEVTLLDIGAGVGVIHHELIGRSIGRAVHVEASDAYLAEARGETARRGHSAQVRFVQGDVVDRVDELEQAAVVTLDRVICCYPDYATLIARSAEKAGRYYGMSVPRDRWYVRAVVAIENFVRRLKGDTFRTFVHPTDALDRLLREAGFVRRAHRTTMAWTVSLYVRLTAGRSRES